MRLQLVAALRGKIAILGGMDTPLGLIFGPDGNGDGHQDLYVTTSQIPGLGDFVGHDGSVNRFDGVTGAFIDTFIPPGGIRGRLNAGFLTFTETDPVTLEYLGESPFAPSKAGKPSASSPGSRAPFPLASKGSAPRRS